MASLDAVSLGILLGALLLLAGILSSLIALRFGAPLLLVFLLIGMLAGEAGPGGIAFNDVRTTYLVGSIALSVILFDGGFRTRLQTFRAVLGPSVLLATLGVLVTTGLVAPMARYVLDLNWIQALLVGAVVGSTDAAAVFFLLHAHGLRLRPRVSATLEIESATNDPAAVLLTIMLIQILLLGNQPWDAIAVTVVRQAVVGGLIGVAGGRLIVAFLNRLGLQQGLHAPFVAVSAVVVFGVASSLQASGFLAVYLAGLLVGNRPTRAHNSIRAFLDATTWLAQIVMFVLLGLLAWPQRLVGILGQAVLIALALMLVARPAAVFLCLAPYRFSVKERLFISWVGLRGAVGIFLASIPLLVELPAAYLYFDVGFIVVLISLVVQGWSIGFAARKLDVAFARADPRPQRVELDLPGQLSRELVGYAVAANSPYLRRGLLPSWAKPTLVVRDERVLTPADVDSVREGDYIYLLAPPERAQALDRFFSDLPPPARPDPRLLGDFFVSGDVTLGALAEIYGLQIAPEHVTISLADYFAAEGKRPPKQGDTVLLGPIAIQAHRVANGRVTTVGLLLAEPDPEPPAPATVLERLRHLWHRFVAAVLG